MSLAVQQFPLDEEYKKHSNISRADISKLRAWLHTQPHLPGEHITDLDLILGYFSCDCSMEVTKQVLDLHYTVRTHSKIFKNRQAYENTFENMKSLLMLPLKERANDGSAILYAALINCDANLYDFCESSGTMMLVMDLWQYEEGTWPGLHLLFDMAGFTLAHLAKLNIETLQQLFFILQETMLLKVKGLHFLNAPPFVDKMLLLFRPFIKKQLIEVLHVHQPGLATLTEYIALEALPLEAGGTGPTKLEATAYMLQKVKDNLPFLEMEMKKRVDESRRPGKPSTASDFFGGVDGSFKELDID